jgi:hypothetical protein
VVSIDRPNRKATVTYIGETAVVTVGMGTIQPASNGQIVRIAGRPGDKYIDDVLAGAAYIDHGGLVGLGDDDHTQYVLVGGDTMAGTLTVPASNLVLNSVTQLPYSQNTTAPSSPVLGQQWLDTTSNRLKIWNGSAWRIMGGTMPSFELRSGLTWTTDGTNATEPTWDQEDKDSDGFHSSTDKFITIPTGLGGGRISARIVDRQERRYRGSPDLWVGSSLRFNCSDARRNSGCSVAFFIRHVGSCSRRCHQSEDAYDGGNEDLGHRRRPR